MTSMYEKVTKVCTEVVSHYLVLIINKSLQRSHVPKQLQGATVILVYKKGDKTLCFNYRPVSVLPTFSKVYEKIVYNRLMTHLTQYAILAYCQYGFRPIFFL